MLEVAFVFTFSNSVISIQESFVQYVPDIAIGIATLATAESVVHVNCFAAELFAYCNIFCQFL